MRCALARPGVREGFAPGVALAFHRLERARDAVADDAGIAREAAALAAVVRGGPELDGAARAPSPSGFSLRLLLGHVCHGVLWCITNRGYDRGGGLLGGAGRSGFEEGDAGARRAFGRHARPLPQAPDAVCVVREADRPRRRDPRRPRESAFARAAARGPAPHRPPARGEAPDLRSEEHTSELQSPDHL